MNKALTVCDVFKAIEEQASKSTAELRMVRTIAVGKGVRQGDVYLVRVRHEDFDRGSATPYGTTQLAPGTTQGSRHVVEGRVSLWRTSSDPLVGPTVEAAERFTVTHPEHAHVSLPSGTYRVTYQRDFAREERARVQD